MEELDLKNKDQVFAFLGDNRDEAPAKYIEEYKGSRKIRNNQIGSREDVIGASGKVSYAEKLAINHQKKIVRTAVSMLFGSPADITANDSEDATGIEVLRILKANRTKAKLMKFAEDVMSQTIGVFIFSIVDNLEAEKEIKMRSYNSENGTFTPQYDEYGDLVAFYWEFKQGEDDILWVFDNLEIHKYFGGDYAESITHGFDIIPVVFLKQDFPEWWDVKEMIDRSEMILSKLAASNNYFAFPILKLKGGTAKDEKGKEVSIIDVDDDGKTLLLGHAIKDGHVIQADAEFLKMDTAIDSIEGEVKWLLEFIHSISQTPNLSFDNLKGIGSVSGIALELMFMDAINKAVWKRGDYRTVIERIISVIRSGMKGTQPSLNSEELDFDIKFNLSLPKDIEAEVRMISEATGNKPFLSAETATKISPLTQDVADELDLLAAEKSQSLGETTNF